MDIIKKQIVERLKALHVVTPDVRKTWDIFDSMRVHQNICIKGATQDICF